MDGSCLFPAIPCGWSLACYALRHVITISVVKDGCATVYRRDLALWFSRRCGLRGGPEFFSLGFGFVEVRSVGRAALPGSRKKLLRVSIKYRFKDSKEYCIIKIVLVGVYIFTVGTAEKEI